ncbi:MAG: ethanolamine ammonia-lyase subunit EutC [Firmicutes bacterium]|nr:ethanolamine ammonia-lyase subunit EutC [Bacillota bacterium]
MLDEKLIALITEEVVRQLTASGRVVLPERLLQPEVEEVRPAGNPVGNDRLLEDPLDPEALERMKRRTTARIGVGKAGARLKTQTMLSLRADHARAQDSVFADVDPAFIEKLGLLSIESQAGDRNTHITRPDLGRKICPKGVEALRQHCEMSPDVQIYASDGLSSAAIEANLEKILPVLTEGLQAKGLKVGTPFYMRFGRVAAEDQVAEVLGAKVACVLIGERPGLATAESMSAYIVYNAYVGIPEAKRTVVSNIHKDGLTAVEAGDYITEVIQQILDRKASGVDLVK